MMKLDSGNEGGFVFVRWDKKKKENYVPDVIILLSNTHPFKTSEHIDEALSLLIKKKYDSIILAVSHSIFKKIGFKKINYSLKKRGFFYDVKSLFYREKKVECL